MLWQATVRSAAGTAAGTTEAQHAAVCSPGPRINIPPWAFCMGDRADVGFWGWGRAAEPGGWGGSSRRTGGSGREHAPPKQGYKSFDERAQRDAERRGAQPGHC